MVPNERPCCPPGDVCLLKKSLYELKQASRQWNMGIPHFMLALQFTQPTPGACLFVYWVSNSFLALLIYEDDILIVDFLLQAVTKLKATLHSRFTIKDLHTAHYLLSIELRSSLDGLVHLQKRYLADILSSFNPYVIREVTTPMQCNNKFSLNPRSQGRTQGDHYPPQFSKKKFVGYFIF